jgi:hypothetical protein
MVIAAFQKIKDTITHLEKMKAQEMLSSQSGLRNVWEEICVQVQAMSPRFEDAARESSSVTMLK